MENCIHYILFREINSFLLVQLSVLSFPCACMLKNYYLMFLGSCFVVALFLFLICVSFQVIKKLNGNNNVQIHIFHFNNNLWIRHVWFVFIENITNSIGLYCSDKCGKYFIILIVYGLSQLMIIWWIFMCSIYMFGDFFIFSRIICCCCCFPAINTIKGSIINLYALSFNPSVKLSILDFGWFIKYLVSD